MNPVPFCIPGKHAGEVPCEIEPSGEITLPPGWRRVPAHINEKTRAWFYAAHSKVQICVCSEHHIVGEPEAN